MKTLELHGCRWFNRRKGQTYHSVVIMIDDETVHKVDYAYGYDGAWMDSAATWLEANGKLPNRTKHEALWRYCERKRIKFTYTINDVPRKKDL